MTTLLISDLHLGARNSRTDLLVDLLTSSYDRLILNGDIVDSPDPRLFRDFDWKVIDQLRTVARTREMVVIRGNHDILPGPENKRGSSSWVSELLGRPVVEEYTLEVGHRRYRVVHGDQYDTTLNLTWVGDVADVFYRRVQRISRGVAHWLKTASKQVCGVVDSVRQGALAQAQTGGFDGVITGHTHFHEDMRVDGLHYLNMGCWVDHPCSYLKADSRGVTLHHWAEGDVTVRPAMPRVVVPEVALVEA